MGDLILDEDTAKCMRFSCDCGDPGHILDLWLGFDDGICVDVSLYESLWNIGDTKLKDRVKAAYSFIKSGYIIQHHFRLGSNDVPMMTAFLGSTTVIELVNNLSKIGEDGEDG